MSSNGENVRPESAGGGPGKKRPNTCPVIFKRSELALITRLIDKHSERYPRARLPVIDRANRFWLTRAELDAFARLLDEHAPGKVKLRDKLDSARATFRPKEKPSPYSGVRGVIHQGGAPGPQRARFWRSRP